MWPCGGNGGLYENKLWKVEENNRKKEYMEEKQYKEKSVKKLLYSSVVWYQRYLDTYRQYLRDDTSIAKVTIYRGIS